MKKANEDDRVRLKLLSLVSLLALLATTTATMQADIRLAEQTSSTEPASDLVLTNGAAQVADLFLQGYSYPVGTWVWHPLFFEPMTTVWFDKLPEEWAGLTNCATTQVHGVGAWPLWATLYPQSNTIVVLQPWSESTLAEAPVMPWFPSWEVYGRVLRDTCALTGINMPSGPIPEAWEKLVKDGYEQFAVPQVTMHAWLLPLQEAAAYYATIEAEAKAMAEADAAAAAEHASSHAQSEEGGGYSMLMGGDPCAATETDGFSIVSVTLNGQGCTVTWESCTNFLYQTETSEELSTQTVWTVRATMIGQDGLTSSWTDEDAPWYEHRFYRVRRLVFDGDADGDGLSNIYEFNLGTDLNNLDSDGDGLPDGWEVVRGLSPLSATGNNGAAGDPDSDSMDNLTEFQLGTNPTGPNNGDELLDLVVNGGEPWAASQIVSVDPLSSPHPHIKLSVNDPNLWRTIDPWEFSPYQILDNPGQPFDLTLPEQGSGLYNLYFQYLATNGVPVGPILHKRVEVDRVPPFVQITGPTTNSVDVGDQAFINLRAVAYDFAPQSSTEPDPARPLKMWVNGQRHWGRFDSRIEVERFPVSVGTNTITVTAEDQAGNQSQDTLTWIVDPSTDTIAPTLTNVNLTADTGPGATGAITVPDLSELWLQGDVDDANAIVTAIINGGDAIVMNVVSNQFGQFVPLDFGTNSVVLAASDAAGNATSNTFTVVRADRFRAAITSPDFGAFADGQSNIVSGYVSATIDSGLPTETNLVSVTINGLSTTLHWDQMDENGNVPFETNEPVPPPGGGGIEPLDIGTGWGNGEEHTTPGGMQHGYEVIAKTSVEESVWPGLDGAEYSRPGYGCGGNWRVGPYGRSLLTNVYALSMGSSTVEVDVYSKDSEPVTTCTTKVDPEALAWGPWSDSEYQDTLTEPAKKLLFGDWRLDGYERFDNGREQAFADRDKITASLTFRAPVQYATNTTVIFTFEGVDYTRADGVPLDLSQVKYQGQDPVAWSNEARTVSYLITVNRERPYTISSDDFHWPSATTNYVYRYVCCYYGYNPQFSYLGHNTETTHWLSWTNFHNELLAIVGSSRLVSTTHAAGSNVTLTATNYPPGATFQWSKSATSTNISFVGSTTGPSVVVAPIQGKFTTPGATEVITMICTLTTGYTITNTHKIIVQKPTALQTISEEPGLKTGFVRLKVRYQILDQNGRPLRPVIKVGNANVRIANLKASETLAWQCNTFCVGAQPEVHDLIVPDDGTFSDTQEAPTSCENYVRSQTIYVGILNFSSQDIVGYYCICYESAERFTIHNGTANGAACCATCE